MNETLEARRFADAYVAVMAYSGQEGERKPSGPMVDEVMSLLAEKLEHEKERR